VLFDKGALLALSNFKHLPVLPKQKAKKKLSVENNMSTCFGTHTSADVLQVDEAATAAQEDVKSKTRITTFSLTG